ncbi:MAG: pyridoxal phosphate-dependent aminotransferase [Chitinophagales bacterium]|nr:pyridoxal phosphate-dependent aminotransferase [Chitinophagales bacterium]
MPSISHKGQKMPASPIRKLVPFAEKAKREGKSIYHLNIGQPDIATPAEMWEAVQNFKVPVLEYSHSAGFESYRKKLAAAYGQWGIEIDHNDLIVTTGGSEAITFGFFSCLDAGDEIIIPEPFYANYNGFATAGDIVVKPITSTIENGFALPPISEFEKLIGPRTKAILICNPNNPTGYLYSADELESLRQLVLKYDLFWFADEVYREFCYDGRQHISILTLDGLDQHAVVIDSISKRYSACGARIGCLISRNKELMQTALKFAQARLSPPTIEQVAAEASLLVKPSYFQQVKEEYVRRRDLMVAELNKIPGVLCPNPGGAFYAIARLPIDNADYFCQWLLEEFSYDNKTLMLAPAGGFYSSPGKGTDEVRIAYVLNTDDLKDAISLLGKALQVYPGCYSMETTNGYQGN